MSERKETDEGARSFAVVLHQIEDGLLHAELSSQLRLVCKELERAASNYQAKAKGSLSLTLEITAEPSGIVVVKGDVKAKLPKAKRAGSPFWLTKSGNLTLEHPRQLALPVRAAPEPETRTVEDVEPRATRKL